MPDAPRAFDDQLQRLKELLATDAATKEAPLRRDVRNLGRILGNVIKEQAGEDVFEAVEGLRLLAIAQREGHDVDLSKRAKSSLRDPQKSFLVARAFALYFELVNLAETNPASLRRIVAHRHDPVVPAFQILVGRLDHDDAGVTAEQFSDPCGRRGRVESRDDETVLTVV